MFAKSALVALTLSLLAASVSAAPAHSDYSIREWKGTWPKVPVNRRAEVNNFPVELPSKSDGYVPLEPVF